MAIYDVKVGEGVIPNLPKQVGFTVDDMEFNKLDSAIESQVNILDNQNKQNYSKKPRRSHTERNVNAFAAAIDKLTNFRVDNPNQQAIVDDAKKNSGIENVFSTATLESLKSPYGAKIVESAYSKFASDPKVSQVVLEQAYADKYQKDINKINDPVLRQMALEDYQRYRTGDLTGDALVADDYMELDLPKVIGTDFKQIVPKVEEHMKRSNEFNANYVESLKKRDATAMRLVFENRLSDPKFVNNLVAKGLYDKNTQSLTPEGESYVNALTDQYTVEDAKLKNVRYDKQTNRYESNITKTSTFKGHYNSNTTITKNGDFSYTPMPGKSKQATMVNAIQNEVSKYGINVVGSSDMLSLIENKKDKEAIIRKAFYDSSQSAFHMMATGHNPAEVAKYLVENDTKPIAFGKYLNKGRDRTLTDIFIALDTEEKGKFLRKATDEAKDYLQKNGISLTNPSNQKTSKNSTSSKKPVQIPKNAFKNFQ